MKLIVGVEVLDISTTLIWISHYCEQCGRVVSCRLWRRGRLMVATAVSH